jgi:ATP/maltotriose-dependent transcriptional regulator MalT
MILSLSSLTIKNHLQRIYRKLDVHNRVQAITRCRELKLLVNTEQ